MDATVESGAEYFCHRLYTHALILLEPVRGVERMVKRRCRCRVSLAARSPLFNRFGGKKNPRIEAVLLTAFG